MYNFCSDPILVRLTEQIFMELSKNPGTMVALQQRLIPTLVSILQAQPLKVPLGLQAVSISLLFSVNLLALLFSFVQGFQI